ncbi:MAG: TonB-dependent receptor [Paludibacter sp.]|jgi:hypothetical protein|nr:TonB-dependent receptor [Paludibacter sp.]
MRNKSVILFLFLLFIPAILSSQNKLRVYGYVIDPDNRSIESANVHIENSSIFTSTNRNGYYELDTDISDSAVIVFSMLGYQSLQHTLFPTPRGVIHISVELQPITHQIRDIEVVALRRQTGTMDYLSQNGLRLMPNTSGGIESFLITMSGVSQTNELSSQYNVRGGNFDENIVYVNGIEVYRPLLIRSGQQEGLSFINPDMVSNVGFSAGGFEAMYGDKMSSVLDITYKRPEQFESSLSLSLLGASAYVATAGKRFTQMHGFRYKTSEYLLGTLDTKGEYSPAFVDYQTSLTYQLAEKWNLSFLGNFSQNSYRFVPRERETSFGTYSTPLNLTIFYEGQERDLFRTAFGALTLSNTPNKHLKINFLASAYYTNENETYDILGEYTFSEVKTDAKNPEDKIGAPLGIGKSHEHARNRLKASVVSLGHSGEYQSGYNLLKWGFNVNYETISDQINEWEWRDSAGYSLPYSDKSVDLLYNLKSLNKLNSIRTTGYAQYSFKKNTGIGYLALTGGLRANAWTFNRELLVSPRFSVAIVPPWEKDFTFRFATGVYYQSPFYKEVRDTVADKFGNISVQLNENIRAQRSLHFVLAGDYYFRAWGRPFKFTAETYLKLADRVESYSVDNVRIRYSGQNDAEAYTAGLDLKLFGELVPGVDSWLNFSLMSSRENLLADVVQKPIIDANGAIESYQTVYPGWMPRPNEQRYVFSMMFQDYLPNNPKYKLQLKMIFSDGLPFGAPHNELYRAAFRTPAYRRVDIGASRVLASGKDRILDKAWLKHVKNIWLNLEVLNLMDFKNVNSYYWVTVVSGIQYATPNYLTGRQFNLKLIVDFK